MKITPFHDVNDYEIGLRHNLSFRQILNEEGRLVNVPEDFMVFFLRFKFYSKFLMDNIKINYHFFNIT